MRPRGVKKLRHVFDKALLVRLARQIKKAHPRFDCGAFVSAASKGIYYKSFSERITHVAKSLHDFLPSSFGQALAVIMRVAPRPNISEGYGTDNYHSLILSRYVSLYGLEHPEVSLRALARLTQSYTSEFDIRPFIVRYPNKTFAFLRLLTKSRSFHKRRLASEGCRPRLPMAFHLSRLKEDPRPCVRLLKSLRRDPTRYVQKSVANNLCDILKDNPRIALDVVASWSTEDDESTRWIVKRVLRRGLGDKQALALDIPKQIELWKRRIVAKGRRISNGKRKPIAILGARR